MPQSEYDAIVEKVLALASVVSQDHDRRLKFLERMMIAYGAAFVLILGTGVATFLWSVLH